MKRKNLTLRFEEAFKTVNKNVINNYSNLKLYLLSFPLFFIIAIIIYLYCRGALSVDKYIELQRDCFFLLNSKLSQFPNLQYNLTQFGDALIFLSLLAIFIVYAPKIWEALLSALLISGIFSCAFKKMFRVPRPAAVFDNNSFTIIGKKLCSHSLPSGHSITIFAVLNVLLFAFLPKKMNHKIIYFPGMIFLGLIFAFSRVGVGAHYPLDVVFGSIIGYISGLSGFF